MPAPVVRYKVTMINRVGGQVHQGTDYVAEEDLDTYIADARSRGWQEITVSVKPDHGPGGPNGAYTPIKGRA